MPGKNAVLVNQEIQALDVDPQNLSSDPWYWHWPISRMHASISQWIVMLQRGECKLDQFGTAVIYS